MASSWAPPAHPTRRSRSRSPGYRGGYAHRPPYPEQGYGDPYRPDWDVYDRERAWANYERDRAAYDYGRRGRSRSPGVDEAGRKRRRSMSPYDSRYDPRPRYAEDYDYGRHGRSPPRGYGSRPGPPDPRMMDYPASLKQYAEWFRYNYPQEAAQEDTADKQAEAEAGDGSKPRNGIRTRWEGYKKDFAAQQLSRMFDHHRKSPWFLEKYSPEQEYVNLRQRVRKRGLRGYLAAFLDGLDFGQFDPDLSEPVPDAEPPASSAKEGANGHEAAEEGKPEADEQNEEEQQGTDEKQDMNGKLAESGVGVKRAAGTEEVTVPTEGNQVMIRTIPPDIGRLKLEEALTKVPGFVYLALGEPQQKKNFYRAGWIKFRDDADMTTVMTELAENKIEGFKLHVTHLLKPFTNRVKFAPEVASRPDRMEKDLANAKALAALLEAEYNNLRTARIPPVGAAVKPALSENAEGENKSAGGENDIKMEEGDTERKEDERPMQPEEDDEPEPRESGSVAIERRTERLLAEMREAGAGDDDDEKAWQEKKTRLTLDLYLAYLRAAFHTCYYCALVTDHAEELQRKCIKHVRKPLSKALREEMKAEEEAKVQKAREEEERAQREREGAPTLDGEGEVGEGAGAEGKNAQPDKAVVVSKDRPTEGRDWKRNDERWLDWLDSKIALLINRDGVNPKDYNGKSYDEEMAKLVEPYVKQEDEGKFRCKECQKLFKATSFVEKHVANKHPEHTKPLDDLPFFNNFALDPHRIQPFTHPPSAAAINQAPTPQAYGMHPYPPDYGRGATGYYGGYGGYPPPAYGANGYYDPYAYSAGPYPYSARGPRDAVGRLSDRLGGYAPGYEPAGADVPLPAGVGLPQKPVQATLEPGPGARRNTGGRTGPPPPPPPDAKEDPRAAAGRKVSYHDMDDVAEGDVELNY